MPTQTNDNKNFVSDDAYKSSVFEDGGNLVVDLRGIEEAKFEAIPKGIYPAEVDSCEYGLSNNSGAPMFTVICMITEGAYEGRKLYTYLSFSQKALPYTKATIQRFAPELLIGSFKPEQIAAEGRLLGKPCRIRVALEDYQGEPRSKIAQVLAPSSNGAVGGSTGAGKGFF